MSAKYVPGKISSVPPCCPVGLKIPLSHRLHKGTTIPLWKRELVGFIYVSLLIVPPENIVSPVSIELTLNIQNTV